MANPLRPELLQRADVDVENAGQIFKQATGISYELAEKCREAPAAKPVPKAAIGMSAFLLVLALALPLLEWLLAHI